MLSCNIPSPYPGFIGKTHTLWGTIGSNNTGNVQLKTGIFQIFVMSYSMLG